MNNYIFLIPARAGSKRIPGKNTILFNSKPLIEHSIEFALRVTKSERIYVSTDSEKAKEVAKKHNVEIHHRNSLYAQDETSMLETTLDFINTFNISDYTNLVLLQPTSPFRRINFFNKLKKNFQEADNPSSAFSVVRCKFFHPAKIGSIHKNNSFKFIDIPKEENIDNDKKAPFYVISGTYYIVPVWSLKETNSFIGSNPIALEEDDSTFCNLDSQRDLLNGNLLAESTKCVDY